MDNYSELKQQIGGMIIKNKIKYSICSLLYFFFFLCGCNNKFISNKLVLTKISLPENAIVDTIESYANKGCYLINIKINRAFDDFTNYKAFLKTGSLKNNKPIIYKIESDKNGIRVSKKFIAIVEGYGTSNWGWFNLYDSKINDSLPNLNHLLDSLKASRSNETFFQERNGYITEFINGKIIRLNNYGNLITKNYKLDFDSLDYGLYKLNNNNLILMSKNGNDIFKQKEGVFFIPSPGYGVIEKFDKYRIFDKLDSLYQLDLMPNYIKFDPN
jgi:hypothetical protein